MIIIFYLGQVCSLSHHLGVVSHRIQICPQGPALWEANRGWVRTWKVFITALFCKNFPSKRSWNERISSQYDYQHTVVLWDIYNSHILWDYILVPLPSFFCKSSIAPGYSIFSNTNILPFLENVLKFICWRKCKSTYHTILSLERQKWPLKAARAAWVEYRWKPMGISQELQNKRL